MTSTGRGDGGATSASSPSSGPSATGRTEATLVLCCLITAAQMTWGAVVPVLPGFLDAFGIGATTLGLVVSAFAIGRVVANIPAGIALRRLPARPYALGLAAALAAVTALTAAASTLPLLIVARLVAGVLGGACVTVAFAVLVAGARPDARGRVIAVATVVQMAGAAAGSVLGGVVLAVAGTAWVFQAAAVPLVLVVGWDLVRPARAYWEAVAPASSASPVPERSAAAGGSAPSTGPVEPGSSVSSGDPAGSAARPAPSTDPVSRRGGARGVLLGLVALSFAVFFVRFAAEQGLVPVLAYDAAGLDSIGLGAALAAGTLASLAIVPLIGRLVDTGWRVGILIPCAVVAATGLVVVATSSAPVAFAAGVVLYSVATSGLNVVPGVVTGERFSARDAGVVVGLTRTAGDIGAAAGPVAVFAVADAAGSLPAMGLAAGALVVAALAAAVPLLRRR